MPCADLASGVQAFLRVRRRHADVDKSDVRAKIANAREQRLAVADLVNDVEVVLREQPRDALADEGCVVGDYDAHGMDARMTVPWPGWLSITSVVSRASSLSRSPASPESAATCAPPTPLSVTVTQRGPPS